MIQKIFWFLLALIVAYTVILPEAFKKREVDFQADQLQESSVFQFPNTDNDQDR